MDFRKVFLIVVLGGSAAIALASQAVATGAVQSSEATAQISKSL